MTEQRYQAVLAVLADGLSVSEVAVKVGVSRQSLHGVVAPGYALGGLEQLADRSHWSVRVGVDGLVACPSCGVCRGERVSAAVRR